MMETTMMVKGLIWGLGAAVSLFVLGMIALELVIGGKYDRGTN